MSKKIRFNIAYESILNNRHLIPKRASDTLPDWKLHIPAKVKKGDVVGRTARACPAMHDYLHDGFIIPLWTDIALQRVSVDEAGRAVVDPDGEHIRWLTSHQNIPLEFHAYEQVAGAEPLEPPYNIRKVVKPLCPWLVETPPGWSILVLPLYLHEKANKIPLEPIPGIINTDHWHQIHTPCKWKNVQPLMQLKAGTPFMHIIPIPRNEALEAEFQFVSDKKRLKDLVGSLPEKGGDYRRQQKVAEAKAKEMDGEKPEGD